MLKLFLVPFVAVLVVSQPVYRWPLNDLTCGLEVQTSKSDALYPTQATCSITQTGAVVYKSGETLWNDGYVEFNIAQPYIDVAIKACVPFATTTLIMNINPSSDSGVMAHYIATSAPIGEFSEFVVYLIGSKLRVDMMFNGQTLAYNSLFASMPNNEWNFFGFSFTESTKSLTVYKQSGSGNKMNSNIFGSLAVPGTLRFGARQTSIPSDMFQGKINCAMLYSETAVYDETAFMSACSTPWNNVPSSVPSCVTEISTDPPLKVWMLDENSLGMEAKDPRAPLKSPDYRFAEGPTALANKSLLFDGSQYSALTLGGITPTLLAEHQSFGMFIYIDKYNDATLLRVKTPAVDETETVISITNQNVKVTLFDNTHEQCGLLEVPGALPLTTWFVLAFQIEFPGNIKVIVDTIEYMDTHTCGGSAASSTDYTIDVGYDDTALAGFRGRLRCLVLVKEVTDMETVLREACASTTFAGEVIQSSSSTERNLHAKLGMSDAAPGSWLVPQAAWHGRSLAMCGKICLQTRFCRSFKYKKMYDTSEDINCYLYDVVVYSTLTNSPNDNYYILS